MTGGWESPTEQRGLFCYSCGNSYPQSFRFCPQDSADLHYGSERIEDPAAGFQTGGGRTWAVVAILALLVLLEAFWAAAREPRRSSGIAIQQFGELTIRTTPPGASVFLDGSNVGVSPVHLTEIPAGIHQVRAVFPGYSDWRADVEILPSSTKKLVGDLSPLSQEKPTEKRKLLVELIPHGAAWESEYSEIL